MIRAQGTEREEGLRISPEKPLESLPLCLCFSLVQILATELNFDSNLTQEGIERVVNGLSVENLKATGVGPRKTTLPPDGPSDY